MKKIIFTFLVVFSSTFLFSQTNFYYYKDIKKEINIDRKKVNIITTPEFQKTSITYLNVKDFEIKESDNSTEKIATIEFSIEPTEMEYLQKVNALKNNQNVVCVAPFYKNGSHKPIGSSNLFMVQLKTLADSIYLKQFALSKKVTVLNNDKYMPDWWYLKTTRATVFSTLETANQFYETGRFLSIDPAFQIHFFVEPLITSSTFETLAPIVGCATDGLASLQWGLKNTNNETLDINACEAWALSEGDNIKVAVIDTGIWKQHPDLIANIDSSSFNPATNNSPSILNYGYDDNGNRAVVSHGIHVAGIIGADRNNGRVVGIAPKCKIISVSDSMDGYDAGLDGNLHAIRMAAGINWAWILLNGGNSQVINNSWTAELDAESGLAPPILETAISRALINGRNNKGAVVVFAAGNNGSDVEYPANSNPNVLAVGNMDRSGHRNPSSAFGPELDLVAPGTDILSSIYPKVINNHSTNVVEATGTSMAAPFVTGTAALILKVNPCATGKQVRDYIESTCQKVGDYDYKIETNRPNGTRNIEMGYGLLDASAATKMAKDGYKPTFDLYIKDTYTDSGKEPMEFTGIATNSPDIWVRNIDDGIEFHQVPAFKALPNFVYVRVRNKSCVASPRALESDYETLNLYMSIPSATGNVETTLSRMSFNPRENTNYSLVGTREIPVLAAGEDIIFKFPFYPPLPWVPAGGHLVNINFLAKIEGATDPMAELESDNVYNNVAKNNNIAAKNNINISYDYLNDNGGHYPEKVAVGNPFNEPKTYKLELVKEDSETGNAIYEEAEVGVAMDDIIYDAWLRGGKQKVNALDTPEVKTQIVESNHVIIDNIQLKANEVGYIELNFGFMAKQVTNKTHFKYHVIQRDKATNEIVGVETYDISKKPRPNFVADAGNDQEKSEMKP